MTLELEGPRPQRRLTVAFRIILAIPHYFYVAVLSFAVSLAVIAAWFAALVTGRMPDGLGTFISRVLQYLGRVHAYGMLLLTDRYPSFALDEADYPVSVRVPYGGRLNRAAVLFRAILLIPTWIAQWLVYTGLTVCLVFIWLIVLVAGRIPRSLFEAEATTLRYYLRFCAYAAMLTSEYPRGLFGDRGLASDEDADPLFSPPSSAFGAEPAPEVVAAPPRITKLVLSKAAKRIVVLFIVLGVVFGIGFQVLAALQTSEAEEARDELRVAYDDFAAASFDYANAVQSCAVRRAGLECLHTAADDLRGATADFRADLRAIDVPDGALTAARRVDDDLAAVGDVLAVMASTPVPEIYDSRTAELQQLLLEFDRDVAELDEVLAFEF